MGVATRFGHPNLIGEQAKEMEAQGIDTAMKGSIADGDMNGVVGYGRGRHYGPVLHNVKLTHEACASGLQVNLVDGNNPVYKSSFMDFAQLVSKDDSASHHACINTSIESISKGDQNLNVCRQELMPKRKRGRPRKLLVMQDPIDSEISGGAGRLTDNHALTVSKNELIARGKPRKSTCKGDSLTYVASSDVNIEISSLPTGADKEKITAKRKRGRPKKLIDAGDVNSEVSASVATNAGGSSLMETEQTLTAKRKRGRPKKLMGAEAVNSEVSASVSTNAGHSSPMETEQKLTTKRKRGRPPKLINIENAVSSDGAPNVGIFEKSSISAMSLEQEFTVKKKRGRPRLFFAEHNERVVYQCSFQDEDGLAFADLVWGKVRMHQRWSGQIFHSSTTSKAALDLKKMDHHLVACFQDKTFAWCDKSQLKHFQTHLSQLEKQSYTDGFESTMNAAIEEVSRHVVLGLTCQCFMDEAYVGVKKPRIESTEIQVGTCCYNIDKACIISSFEPLNFLQYIQALACSPYARFDRLELGICKSQLKSFYRSKGYSELPVFVHGEGLVDNVGDSPSNKRNSGEESADPSTLISLAAASWMGKSTMKNSFRREKLNIVQCRKRTEFMDKRDHYDARFDVSSYGLSEVAVLDSKLEKGNDKNLGDLITSSSRSNRARQPEVLIKSITNEYSTPTEMLGQLYISASNPLEEYSFLPTIVTFFADFRSWAVSVLSAEEKNTDKLAVKWDMRKSINVSSEKMSAFMQDSYWSDIIVSCEEELASGWKLTDDQSTQQREHHRNEPSFSLPFTSIPYSGSHWQYGSRNHYDMYKMDVKKTNESVLEGGPRYGNNLQVADDGKAASNLMKTADADEFIPTALILSFHEADDIPAETDLVRIFGLYGPLIEADTEVTRSEKHAKVVFKRRSDAEAALCSAGKYSFFGPTLVSYRLRVL